MTLGAHRPFRVELSGDWAYREDLHELGEKYPDELAYTHAGDARWMNGGSDRKWKACAIPGFWPERAAACNHPVWFRRRFELAPHQGRAVLHFEGVNYLCDVWLNGRFIGTHEGYLGHLRFDVTGLVKAVNDLVVKVAPASDVLGEEDQMGQFKRHFVGALGRWDMNDPERKPSGIWGEVWLDLTGEVGIDRAAIGYTLDRLPEAGDTDALVDVRSTITLTLAAAAIGGEVDIEWSLAPRGFEGERIEGRQAIGQVVGVRHVSLDVKHAARLWWTWDLGKQRLYDAIVELKRDGQVLDRLQWTTGFRRVELGAGWDLRLNGVQLYQRGSNYLSELDMASMTPERYRRDLALMKGANLNTVHPFCHVERDAFYMVCDEAGLIVYQDFPIWLMADTASDLVRRATLQFDEMLERLENRPSVAIWNFGSQASVANMDKLCLALADRARAKDPTRIAHMGNCAIAYEDHDLLHATRSFFWKRQDADRFEKSYGWRRDNHMYPGWYFGDVGAIADLPLEDFGLVTEYGAQALPNEKTLETFMAVSGPLDWSAIAARCGQPWLLERHSPSQTPSELVGASQTHQAAVLRFNTEYIRSQKGRPGRGLHVFAFNDCWPSITWSIVDYDRDPKKAYGVLANAMAPIQAFLSRYHNLGSSPKDLELVVVNDGARAIIDVTARVTITTADGQVIIVRNDLGEIGTDLAHRIAVKTGLPPESQLRSVTVELRAGQDLLAQNHYDL